MQDKQQQIRSNKALCAVVDSFERIGGKRKCEILTRKRFGFGWLCVCLTVTKMRAQWRKKSRFKLSSLQMLFWNQIAFRKSKHEHCQRLKWQRENPVTSWERKHIGKMCFLVYQTLHSWVVTIPFFQISLKKHVLYQKYYPGHLKKWHLIDKTCDCCWLLFLKIGFSYVYACIWGVELRHIHKISPSSLLNPCLTSVSNGPNFIFKYKDFVIPSEAETIGFRGNSQHYSNIKSTELLR